jgi:hypothetical protein
MKVVISVTGHETKDKYGISMAPVLVIAVLNPGF